MENNNVTLKKIPLDVFIDALENLYSMGVDFVDITGTANEIQDVIHISFVEDYLTEDSPLKNKGENVDSDNMGKSLSFSDDDINDLT